MCDVVSSRTHPTTLAELGVPLGSQAVRHKPADVLQGAGGVEDLVVAAAHRRWEHAHSDQGVLGNIGIVSSVPPTMAGLVRVSWSEDQGGTSLGARPNTEHGL